MKKLSRRDFLKLCLKGAGLLAFAGIYKLVKMIPNFIEYLELDEAKMQLLNQYLGGEVSRLYHPFITPGVRVNDILQVETKHLINSCSDYRLNRKTDRDMKYTASNGIQCHSKVYANQRMDCIYEEFFQALPNDTEAIFYRRVRTKVGSIENQDVWVCAYDDGKPQEYPMLQGGIKERGDVYVEIVSHDTLISPCGLILDFEAALDTDTVDKEHLLQLLINTRTDAFMYRYTNGQSVLLTPNMGSMFRVKVDLLRGGDVEGVQADLEEFRDFGMQLVTNAVILTHSKELDLIGVV